MRKLDPILDAPRSTYLQIVATKREPRKSTLSDLRRRVLCAYRWYDKWKPDLHRLPPFHHRLSAEEKAALLHCYEGASHEEHPTTPLNRMYKQIRGLTGTCPYCTIIPPQTLDHYLPKDSYPELSVLSINLIPACYTCNKPRDFLAATGERALIHPYFDRIPRDRLLFATVKVVDDTPEAEFHVDTTQCRDPEFGRLYERHVSLLDLKKRYGEWAREPYGLSPIHAVVRAFAKKANRHRPHVEIREEAREVLTEQVAFEEEDLGANHFKVALTRGAAASDEFLDYCLGGAP